MPQCLHRKFSTCEKNSLEIVSNSLSCLRMLIVGLVQRNLSWLIYLEIQNLLPPSQMVWFLTWSTLSESLTQQRRIRLENLLFWSLHHNHDLHSMIHIHPGLNSRLSIRDKPFDCKVVGFYTSQCLFGLFNLCFQLYFISTFRHIFLGNCELEYFDQDLNHEFFSRRGILPSKIHWFRSLPSQSPDSLNFPKKCLHDCSSLEFKLIFLRNPGLLSYIRISTWNVTLVGQYFFWNPLFPSWQQNPENPRILWFDIVFDHYKFKLILLNYRFDLFHEGSIDNFILPEEELDKTVCILILWFGCFHEALNREV